MAKLNTISTDILEIKVTQQSLKDDLVDFKSILVMHSSELHDHSSVLQDHASSIAKHSSKMFACQSNAFSCLAPVQADLKSTNARLSAVETLSSTADVSNSSVSDAHANNRLETLERQHRSHNILFRGNCENSPEGDRVEVSHLVKVIDPSADNQCLHVTRVGKAGTRPRPLKVSFTNPIAVTKILLNKEVICNNPAWKNISLSDDKTP
ncbi:hypothetical protein HHI36_003574 [Cryptolaemus montrouzieri]|uniref:Uncharacterized protein n=1 Tax=Cryptolaemus montrouzieri TaxID=559131 RepID=A0ABD2PEJ2_9CUCU